MKFKGKLLNNEPLSRYTTWRIGGPAKCFFRPADLNDLSLFLQSLPSTEPLLYLGLGSNSLISDKGFPGTVIYTLSGLRKINLLEDNIIRVEAGVSSASLARFSARSNLTGIEFLAGVPGTLGGALRMNAGCFGGETWDHIIAVETINRKGEIKKRLPSEFEIAYRSVKGLNDEWFVAGHFKLQAGNKEKSLSAIRELLDRRAATQPTGEFNCGSVFRNPPGDFAARLIEDCGLKGFSLGGAQVSEKHANFIINTGHATSNDVKQLIETILRKVEDKHNIQLIQEVHEIGE